jgi:hypothetical protein
MQYLVSVIDDTAGLATRDEMAAISAFNDRSGRRVAGSSPVASRRPVRPPSSTTGVGGDVHRRAFLESKEYLAGFWIIEAADLDVALKLAAEGSKHCNRKIEVRPFQ